MVARVDRELSKNIGRTIAKYRVLAGLTQAQVAEKLEISNDAISRMERGKIMPTVARLVQMAQIFGCNTADLLTEGSLSVSDQSQQLMAMLAQLNENERKELLIIIEFMIKWYKKERFLFDS